MGLLQFLRVFVFGRLMYPTKRNCCPLKKCVCQRIIFPLICNGNHSSRRWHSHPEATFVEKVFLNRKCLSSLDKGNPLRLDGFAAARIAEKGSRNNQRTCFHFPDLKKYLWKFNFLTLFPVFYDLFFVNELLIFSALSSF